MACLPIVNALSITGLRSPCSSQASALFLSPGFLIFRLPSIFRHFVHSVFFPQSLAVQSFSLLSSRFAFSAVTVVEEKNHSLVTAISRRAASDRTRETER
jgi:hypothetical protein